VSIHLYLLLPQAEPGVAGIGHHHQQVLFRGVVDRGQVDILTFTFTPVTKARQICSPSQSEPVFVSIRLTRAVA
jgi:hypothetical protein